MKRKLLVTILTASMVCMIGCKVETDDNTPIVSNNVVEENNIEKSNTIEEEYVSEEYQKEIEKYKSEQAEVDKEKEQSSISFTDNDSVEEEKSKIWNDIYKSKSWHEFEKSNYYASGIDWNFVDMGDMVAISGGAQDNLIDISYNDDTTVNITVTNMTTMEEIETYEDPRKVQEMNFSSNKSFDKMRLIITASNFENISNIYMEKEDGSERYWPAADEKHEIDEAVFVVDNVNEGDRFRFEILSEVEIENIKMCAVEYNESAMVLKE